MNASSQPVAGIDLGGTHIRVAVHDRPEEPFDRRIGRVARSRAPRSLAELRDTLGRLAAHRPTGVAVAVPGLVRGTTCRWVPNLGYLDGVDLAEEVAAALGHDVAVAVGNDAHLAMLAEARWGAVRGLHDAVLLAIGTGIGSAVLSDGRIVRGHQGGACSFGWASADPSDPGDDAHGWLERHASGTALDRAGGELVPPMDGRQLTDAARRGNADARRAVERAGTMLGTALAGAVALLDPQLVTVSGGVAQSLDVVLPSLRAAMERQLPAHLRAVPVAAARFGPDATLIGALHAATNATTWWEVNR